MFPILSVDPASLVGDEQLGSKDKFWFAQGEELWLFKFAREHTGEDWAEKVAAEIAGAVQIPAAQVELAEYRGRRGCASLSFVGRDESLVHGNEILAGQIFGYDRQKKLKQSDHTFENIISAVQKLVGGAEWYHVVLKDLAHYLVLDGLICNTDRHHENWGFLMTVVPKKRGRVELDFHIAPSFDHASSLGRELRPERAAEILAAGNIAGYVNRGHGGIYWAATDRHGANPVELVKLAASKFPEYFRTPLEQVARTPVKQLLEIVDAVPDSVISEPARRFAQALLAYTHGVLAGLTV